MKRTQIYLDEEQDRRLGRRAMEDGTTKSDLIRRAIDAYLDGPDDDARRLERFRRAIDKIAGIAPYLPDGRTYVEEIRRAGRSRQEEIDRRWGR